MQLSPALKAAPKAQLQWAPLLTTGAVQRRCEKVFDRAPYLFIPQQRLL